MQFMRRALELSQKSSKSWRSQRSCVLQVSNAYSYCSWSPSSHGAQDFQDIHGEPNVLHHHDSSDSTHHSHQRFMPESAGNEVKVVYAEYHYPDSAEECGQHPKLTIPYKDPDFARLVTDVVNIIMSSYKQGNEFADKTLENALDESSIDLSPELVYQVLWTCDPAVKPAFVFYEWVGRQHGYSHHPLVFNKMVDLLCKNKDFKRAGELVEEMSKKEPSYMTRGLFAKIVTRLAGSKLVFRALKVLDEMPKYGCEPDNVVFGGLLYALCSRNNCDKALELFAKMRIRFPPDARTYAILINGLCKQKRLDDASSLYKNMVKAGVEPDLVVYNIILNGFDRAGKVDEAQRLLIEMKNRGISPNTTSFTSVINALTNANRFDEARELFREMRQRGCSPDLISYSTMTKLYCRMGELKRAYKILDQMANEGIAPNQTTYQFILQELMRRDEMDEIMNLVRFMSENGCPPDLKIYRSLMNFFYKQQLPEQAERIWQEMESRGISPMVDTYVLFIHILVSSLKVTDACKYFKEMVEKGLFQAPQFGTVKIICSSLLRDGRLSDALDIWDCMKRNNCYFNRDVYETWIGALSKWGWILEATGYCIDMIEDGHMPDPRTYEILSRRLINLRSGKIANELRRKIADLAVKHNNLELMKRYKANVINFQSRDIPDDGTSRWHSRKTI